MGSAECVLLTVGVTVHFEVVVSEYLMAVLQEEDVSGQDRMDGLVRLHLPDT